MSVAYPSPRSVRHALSVLERLPLDALFELADRLIDRLDTAEPDLDLEAETDACSAEDAPISNDCRRGIGDEDDAEPEVDDEPDDEDLGANDDEPLFSRRVLLTVEQAEPTKQIAHVWGREHRHGRWEAVR